MLAGCRLAAQSAKNSILWAARGTMPSRLRASSEPLSVVSSTAISSLRARMPSAKRFRMGRRPAGPSAAQAGKARRAAATAAFASSAPPAETLAKWLPSIGERSSNVRLDGTRLPSIQWAVETSTPATLVRAG